MIYNIKYFILKMALIIMTKYLITMKIIKMKKSQKIFPDLQKMTAPLTPERIQNYINHATRQGQTTY